MPKDKSTSPGDEYNWKDTLDGIAAAHRRQGLAPLKPVQLPSGEIYTPNPGTPPDQDPNSPVTGLTKVRMARGGKVKRGHGIAKKGYKKAKIR